MRFELKTVILEDLSYNERESSTNKFLNTAQKIKFSIMNFFSKCDQILSFLRIWSHLLKKFLMENFIFCAVKDGWFTLSPVYTSVETTTDCSSHQTRPIYLFICLLSVCLSLTIKTAIIDICKKDQLSTRSNRYLKSVMQIKQCRISLQALNIADTRN